MELTIESRDPVAVKTGLLVVGMYEGKDKPGPLFQQVDKKLGGRLLRLVKKENFEGKEAQAKLVNTHGKIPAEYVLLLGLGKKDKFDLETARKGAARSVRTALQIRAQNIVMAPCEILPEKFSKRDVVQSVSEGLILACYIFDRYKKKEKNAPEVREAFLACTARKNAGDFKKGIERGRLLAGGVCLARDLINTPARDMTPSDLARTAKSIKGIKTRAYGPAKIRRMKMGAYLGVAKGSANPPAFIEMHYRPSSPKKKVVFVGKGVTFDSGGLSLKPPKAMETMKDDMSGAASVIGLMSVISGLKPKVEVWGLVAAAENMPDANAQRPGDIVVAMNGKTIEVLNTDAEGRLTMADALVYGTRKKPDYIVDVATLTGACLMALGDRISGIMGNNKELVNKLITAGARAGEKMWELPLADEYKDELKSPIADLKNVGGSYGGTINGGLFLQEFVGSAKWAHIDIAGPSWTDKPREYESKGGTGVMVRTFAEFLDLLQTGQASTS